MYFLNKFLVLGSLRSANYIRLQYLFFKLQGSFKRFIFKYLCVCVCMVPVEKSMLDLLELEFMWL